MKTTPLPGVVEMGIICAMYLRRTTKKKGGTDYEYWLLVESVRTARGPRQRGSSNKLVLIHSDVIFKYDVADVV